MVLLTDEEMNDLITEEERRAGVPEQFIRTEFDLDYYKTIALAATKKALIGVGKESKRMDGTVYLVPDYVEYRKALKEVGLE